MTNIKLQTWLILLLFTSTLPVTESQSLSLKDLDCMTALHAISRHVTCSQSSMLSRTDSIKMRPHINAKETKIPGVYLMKVNVTKQHVISLLLYPPHNENVGGYIGFTPSVHPSVRPSVRPSSRIPCPLCSAFSSGWIHFIFTHLIKLLQ